MKTKSISGQASWTFSSDRVEAAITESGGHLAPVRFKLGRREVAPFSVAPWAEEKVDPGTPALLRALRGDFFCAPFGGNDVPYRGEKYPPHGETAGAKWRFVSSERNAAVTELRLRMDTHVRRGSVEKSIQLRRGHAALYCRHVLSGMGGPMSFGHHATLRFPDQPGSGNVSTSAIRFGQVAPVLFEQPALKGYSSLKTGAEFRSLARVPSAFGGTVDVSSYPARRGFEDLLQIAHQAQTDFAWTAVAFPAERYVWIALKDPRVLQSTVFWLSNGGRHYAPWSGRHINVMGLEDVTSYFHYGLAESAKKNPWSEKGIATSLDMKPDAPLVVNYIMGVAAIPAGFNRVKSIRRVKAGVEIVSTSGQVVHSPIDAGFLREMR